MTKRQEILNKLVAEHPGKVVMDHRRGHLVDFVVYEKRDLGYKNGVLLGTLNEKTGKYNG